MSSKRKKSHLLEQKNTILTFFKNNTDRIYTLSDVYNFLNISDADDKIFVRLLVEELEDEGKIKSAGRSRYVLAEKKATQSQNFVVGKVDFVNAKFAFIRYDDDLSDVFVPAEDLAGALDGDTVEVKIVGERKGGKNPEGRVVKIINRGRDQIVGKIKVFPNYGLVTPDNKGFHENVFIAKGGLAAAETNDLVVVKIINFPNGSIQASGEVVEVLGKSGENDAEMNAIMAEFGLPVKFPKEVLEEAEKISEVISEKEIAKRRDMRKMLTFTIDPTDAKDFDDALSFEILPNQNFEIGVHIADVSHYVLPNTKLEEEAYKRATSVYLVDRTVPMLPEKLSNNLCSLRPNEDKLVFSAVFEMDKDANVINEWFGRAIIHSDRRFSYEQAQEVIETPVGNYGEILTDLNSLAKKLRADRFKNGAFNFETNEVKFNLDEKGKPLGVYQKIRKDAHKLIEEFMLLANKRVAEFVYKLNPEVKNDADQAFTMVYRVHEPPNPTKMETFSKFANKLGFSVKTGSTSQLSSSLNHLMTEIEGSAVQNVLESLAIRTMSKARYSTQNLGHFGLAFHHYSHFTSPIRRYPDVMAHRMLQHYLNHGGNLSATEFEVKCNHSSEQEKLAAEAERASIKYKQVEFMSFQPYNEVFEGVVSGVAEFGLFVEINETGCEGMVRLAELNDDYYEYDADNFRVVGKRKGKIIGFGNKVKVKILNTDLERRSIDLELVSVEGSALKSQQKNNEKSGQRTAKNGQRKGRR